MWVPGLALARAPGFASALRRGQVSASTPGPAWGWPPMMPWARAYTLALRLMPGQASAPVRVPG